MTTHVMSCHLVCWMQNFKICVQRSKLTRSVSLCRTFWRGHTKARWRSIVFPATTLGECSSVCNIEDLNEDCLECAKWRYERAKENAIALNGNRGKLRLWVQSFYFWITTVEGAYMNHRRKQAHAVWCRALRIQMTHCAVETWNQVQFAPMIIPR